ncbi:MAG: two-component regulator propeller domain-containing protein [Prolixibacteraceae bacterium]|jgi:hypothetical protein
MFMFCVLWSSASLPQKLNKAFLFRHYDSQHGLSGNQISHVFQDSKGYLWVSTWKGFSRFDGVSFTNYREADGLFASTSFEAFEFRPGHFLIQHIKGISFSIPQKGNFSMAFPDSVRGLRIGTGLYFNSKFWIFNAISNNSGNICHLRFDEKWTAENIIFNDTVLKIVKAPELNTVFILTATSVYRIMHDEIVKLADLKQNYRSFSTDSEGNCWGFSDTDSRFYTIGLTSESALEKQTNLFVSNLFSKKLPDTFIVLPDNDGIVYYNNNYELFKTDSTGTFSLGQSFSLIRKMMIDKEKNLWVATEEGLYNFFRLDFEQIKLTFTEKSDMFWSIGRFGKNRIVAGRFGYGFVELMDSVWKPVAMDYRKDPKTGMEPYSAYMGAISTGNGEAWFPVWKGLIKFDKSGKSHKFSLQTTPEHLWIDQKSPDTIFAAATNGMLVIEPNKKIKFIGRQAGFAIGQNESIVRDKNNSFWLGSSQGQTQILANGKVSESNSTSALPNVISSQKDANENLWFGTDKGLYYFNYQAFTKISPEILTESIDLIVNYNDSLLVAAGFQKLVLINYKRNPFEIRIYDEHELGVVQNTSMIDEKGYLWFSGMYNLVRIHPLRLYHHFSNLIPQPFVSSIESSHNNVNWTLRKPNENPEVGNNNLRFKFIALTFRSKKHLKYRYMLENFNAWSEPSGNNEVYFSNLNPGKYRFIVQCSFDGQNWSQSYFSDEIEIEALWFQKAWVRVVALILVLFLISGITYLFNYNLHKRKIRKLIEQKKLNQLQLQLVRSKQIPHFSGNALANIEHYIFKADLKQANKYLTLFSRLLNLTLLDADKGTRPLNKELELIKIYLDLEIMRFNDAFSYQIDIDDSVDENVLIPNMLLHTWVENALRHGLRHKKSHGMILIDVKKQDDILCLSVQDDGIGREMAQKLKTQGTEKGLKILEDQIKIYNEFNEQQISIEVTDLKNAEGEAAGTRFTIFIPEKYSFNI